MFDEGANMADTKTVPRPAAHSTCTTSRAQGSRKAEQEGALLHVNMSIAPTSEEYSARVTRTSTTRSNSFLLRAS